MRDVFPDVHQSFESRQKGDFPMAIIPDRSRYFVYVVTQVHRELHVFGSVTRLSVIVAQAVPQAIQMFGCPSGIIIK